MAWIAVCKDQTVVRHQLRPGPPEKSAMDAARSLANGSLAGDLKFFRALRLLGQSARRHHSMLQDLR
jgi:hypothetical protein